MNTKIIISILIIWISTNMTACSMHSAVLPTDGPTMAEIYEQYMIKTQGQKFTYLKSELINNQTRFQSNPFLKPRSNFMQTPNPDIPIFIYPHLAGNSQIPIPGYVTIFTLYEKVHYY